MHPEKPFNQCRRSGSDARAHDDLDAFSQSEAIDAVDPPLVAVHAAFQGQFETPVN